VTCLYHFPPRQNLIGQWIKFFLYSSTSFPCLWSIRQSACTGCQGRHGAQNRVSTRFHTINFLYDFRCRSLCLNLPRRQIPVRSHRTLVHPIIVAIFFIITEIHPSVETVSQRAFDRVVELNSVVRLPKDSCHFSAVFPTSWAVDGVNCVCTTTPLAPSERSVPLQRCVPYELSC